MILDAYAALLASLGAAYTVLSDELLVNLSSVHVSVAASRSGIVTLSSYVGLVDYGVRNATRLCGELRSRFGTEYNIYPEKYSGYYEIEIERSFPYTDPQGIHEAVLAMAALLEEGYEIGKEMLGKEIFHR